jgi:hypothetical protein
LPCSGLSEADARLITIGELDAGRLEGSPSARAADSSPSYPSSSCTAELEPRNSSPPLPLSQTKADASYLVIVNKEHSSIFER